MKEALKSLTTNNQVDTPFDLRDKHIEKLKKPQTFDFSFFIGKCHFRDDALQSCIS